MAKHLQRELDQLKSNLLTLGAMVEEALAKSIKAFNERRLDLAKSVIDEDEGINRRDVELEEECLKLLALYQPVAEDLRFITTVMKINNDLERMGDYAVSIAERAVHMMTDPPIPIPGEILTMEEMTRKILRETLDAFVKRDPKAARRICSHDDEIDGLNRLVIKEMRSRMKKSTDTIDQCLDVITVSRRLERVADLATNIAEDVIYMVEGEILRHRLDDNPREEGHEPA